MSMVKVIELLAQSEESWEDATRQAVERASQTIRNIQSVWVSEFEAVVDDNEVTQFRVNVKISSFSKISQASGSPLSSHAEARQWAFSLLAGVFCSGGAPGATVVETADRKRSAPDRGEHRQAAGAAAGSPDRSLPIARLGWLVRLPPDELAALDKFMLEHPDKLLRPLRIRYDLREWLRSSGCLSGGDNE